MGVALLVVAGQVVVLHPIPVAIHVDVADDLLHANLRLELHPLTACGALRGVPRFDVPDHGVLVKRAFGFLAVLTDMVLVSTDRRRIVSTDCVPVRRPAAGCGSGAATRSTARRTSRRTCCSSAPAATSSLIRCSTSRAIASSGSRWGSPARPGWPSPSAGPGRASEPGGATDVTRMRPTAPMAVMSPAVTATPLLSLMEPTIIPTTPATNTSQTRRRMVRGDTAAVDPGSGRSPLFCSALTRARCSYSLPKR